MWSKCGFASFISNLSEGNRWGGGKRRRGGGSKVFSLFFSFALYSILIHPLLPLRFSSLSSTIVPKDDEGTCCRGNVSKTRRVESISNELYRSIGCRVSKLLPKSKLKSRERERTSNVFHHSLAFFSIVVLPTLRVVSHWPYLRDATFRLSQPAGPAAYSQASWRTGIRQEKKRKEKKTSSIEENGIWSIAKVADIEEMLPYIWAATLQEEGNKCC